MIVSIQKGTKAFGTQDVFEDIDFEIRDRQKIALVGRNGSGKTTLLRILSGEQTLDKGDLIRPRDLRIETLSQITFEDETITVEQMLLTIYQPLFDCEAQLNKLGEQMVLDHSEKLLETYANLQHAFEDKGGYTYKSEMMTVFTKFGFEANDQYRSLSTFSSGQKTRLAFVRLLLSKPDLLLLDEPTNHLDMATIEWLESYLKYYDKAILFVSHDRMFIDHVADYINEIEFGNLTSYTGNYSQYQAAKALNQEKQLQAYKRQQKDIERLEVLIEKFRYKRSKAKFAQSKIKYLDRMDKIDAPNADVKNFKAQYSSRLRGGKQVLKSDALTIGYDRALASVDLTLMHGTRLAVIGPNGHGKSTFLKTIIGKIPALSGEILLGHQIEIGYFDQELSDYKSEKTVLEELWDGFPELTHTQVRTVLGRFLFTADEVFKSVNVLSGGEKVRLSLAKLLLQRANLLILDEPTNHLDILGKEALEDALSDYDGTLIFVSHDRYFIQKMATAVLSIENGKADYYPLSYPEYALNTVEVKSEPLIKGTHRDQSKESIGRLSKQLIKLEESITLKEAELQEYREKRYDPAYYHDQAQMNLLNDQIDQIHNELNAFLKDWELVSSKIQELQKPKSE
jgi:ATP-binding cassette subfamily F protein 3